MSTAEGSPAQRALEMRAAGHSLREIADELGRARETVRLWVNPDAAERNRRRSSTYSKTVKPSVRGAACGVCGGPVRCRTAKTCAGCRVAKAQRNNARIAAMYRTGSSVAEIAQSLGMSEGAVAQRAHRLRQSGAASLPRATRIPAGVHPDHHRIGFIRNGYKPPRHDLPTPTRHDPEELQRLIEEQAREANRGEWVDIDFRTTSLDATRGEDASLYDFVEDLT